MALQTKKVSELEQLEQLTDETNIVVEDGGATKRFPAKDVGKVKTVNGAEPDEAGNVEIEIPESPEQVQADLSETDETSKAYVGGVVQQRHLPEGYPYKNKEVLFDGTISVGYYNVPIPGTSADDLIFGETYALTAIFDRGEYYGERVVGGNGLYITVTDDSNDRQFVITANEDGGLSISTEWSDTEYHFILERVVVSKLDEEFIDSTIPFEFASIDGYYDGNYILDTDVVYSKIRPFLDATSNVYVAVQKVINDEYYEFIYGYTKLSIGYNSSDDTYVYTGYIGDATLKLTQVAGEDKMKIQLYGESLDINTDTLLYGSIRFEGLNTYRVIQALLDVLCNDWSITSE